MLASLPEEFLVTRRFFATLRMTGSMNVFVLLPTMQKYRVEDRRYHYIPLDTIACVGGR